MIAGFWKAKECCNKCWGVTVRSTCRRPPRYSFHVRRSWLRWLKFPFSRVTALTSFIFLPYRQFLLAAFVLSSHEPAGWVIHVVISEPQCILSLCCLWQRSFPNSPLLKILIHDYCLDNDLHINTFHSHLLRFSLLSLSRCRDNLLSFELSLHFALFTPPPNTCPLSR